MAVCFVDIVGYTTHSKNLSEGGLRAVDRALRAGGDRCRGRPGAAG